MSSLNLDLLKQFLDSQYSRNLVFKTENIEIVLMCWLPGQKTVVHDHGVSDAITFVLDGEMSCITYYPDGTQQNSVLKKGEMELIPVGIKHEVKNNSTSNITTLHIYSPPLSSENANQSLGYNNETQTQTISLNDQVLNYLVGCVPEDLLKLLSQKEKQRKTVTIIGGGFSGTLVAAQFMKQHISNEELQIILIERAPRFARGFAYSTNSPKHFLNVPAGKMSAFAGDMNHFLEWVQKRNPTISASSFVPRMLYGEYLENVLFQADQNKASNIKFKRINDEALNISIDEKNNQAIVYLESGINIKTDHVVLAVGNYPPKNPNVKKSNFYNSDKYSRDPWSAKATSGFEINDSVLLIGTGLTMIDKAVELNHKKHSGKIYALSRHGLIPQTHDLNSGSINADFKKVLEEKTLKQIVKSIRAEIKQVLIEGGDWRAYIDSLRPHIQTLWQSLDQKNKKQFFRHIRPYWDTHRHRIPDQAAIIIETMINCKQLEIISGRVIEFREKENCVEVFYKRRGSDHIESLTVSKVINCTGSEQDFCQIQDPLIINLLEQGLIKPDSMSLGLEADKNGALLDSNNQISEILYTLGPTLKGQLWETTAVPEIRVQAESLAKNILTKFMNPLKNSARS